MAVHCSKCLWGICCLSLAACDPTFNSQEGEEAQPFTPVADLQVTEDVPSKRLSEVAGQPVFPSAEDADKAVVPEAALAYVGRYQVKISCEDAYVKCETGTADFILTLLPDGTAHRSIVYLGRVMAGAQMNYHLDYWMYDEAAHQIIVHRSNGVEIFYDIDGTQNLRMDLEKIATVSTVNQQYFSRNPLPAHAYYLEKSAD
nr:hypothetical protein [Acinetobacter indicus]